MFHAADGELSSRMPLLKRKPFPLAELPKDLENHELVYQVRFTKEIFRDYNEYLNRINIYRQRVWTCKVTGKTNLTYEEALVSEKHATEKVQHFPKELMAPVLRIIQYSMLSLKDLADKIAAALQEQLFVGAELYGKRENDEYPCKVVKVLEEGGDRVQYEVVWLDRNKKVMETALVNREDLIQKKPPFSRNVLKSFIRESTYRSAPWVLNDKMAQNYGIATRLPEDLRSKSFFPDGLLVNKKREKNKELKEDPGNHKKKKVESKMNGPTTENNSKREDERTEEVPIRYPIDDLLVQPGADDPDLTRRPSPSRDFNVPMDCVGNLLMVWDFCSSFGRLLNLWPFSLEDFENAICHKDSNLVLLMECHSSILLLLLKDNGEYLSAVQKRKRKLKITRINWTEYLCDFIEMINIPELSASTATIKRGHYGLLDMHVKLGILRELVNQALETNVIREKLDDFIEQRQALGATRREEALVEGKQKREEKERMKSDPVANGITNGHGSESLAWLKANSRKNGEAVKNGNGEVILSKRDYGLFKSESNHLDASKKLAKKHKMEVKILVDDAKYSSRKEPKDDKKDATERSTKEQRKEYYEREMEKRFVRTNPLGKDRYYNRYWWFRRDGRIFVESPDSKQWGYYSSVEELDALIGSLNCKGERERALHKLLQNLYSRTCSQIQKRSKASPNKMALEDAVVRRSTRVRAPLRENPANAFLRYVNKWKED